MDKIHIIGKENLKSFFDSLTEYSKKEENQNQPLSKFLEYAMKDEDEV